METSDWKASPAFSASCTLLCQKDAEKGEDDTKVMALGTEDDDPLSLHKMTTVHTPMLVGKEPDGGAGKAIEI